jgi:hypothetical protein
MARMVCNAAFSPGRDFGTRGAPPGKRRKTSREAAKPQRLGEGEKKKRVSQRRAHLRMLTFTTDYGGQADSALRRTWLHQQSPTTFHLLLTFAPLREIFLRFRGSAPRVLGSLRDKVDKPRRDA